jgi:hypothetical protein
MEKKKEEEEEEEEKGVSPIFLKIVCHCFLGPATIQQYLEVQPSASATA